MQAGEGLSARRFAARSRLRRDSPFPCLHSEDLGLSVHRGYRARSIPTPDELGSTAPVQGSGGARELAGGGANRAAGPSEPQSGER